MTDTKSKTIARNTLLLYMRMLLVMAITLYTVRLVLDALGMVDYGLYNVIAGVVTMMASVNSALSAATQRYYSYALGENNIGNLNRFFSAIFNIYLIFSLLVLVLSETVGLWFVNTQLSIPAERMVAVNYLYQFSIFIFIVGMMATPYSSMMIAKEDMNLFAIISVVECLLKLLAVIVLYWIPVDRLIMYGCLLLLVQLISTGAYVLIFKLKYKECSYVKLQHSELYKEIVSFSGWNLFGSLSSVLSFQANTILINIFFGPVVTAARAIALQVYNALGAFYNSFITALRPAMIKSYAEKDNKYLMQLFEFSNKFIYYSLLVIGLPLIFEMEFVLSVWLKEISSDMVIFTQLIVVFAILLALHNPVTIIMQATGKVKKYFLYVESFTLLSMPFTYVAFKLGFPASSTFVVMIIVFALAHLIRLIILKLNAEWFRIKDYMVSFVVPALLITAFATVCTLLMRNFVDNQIAKFVCVVLVAIVSIVVPVLCFALNRQEKQLLKMLIHR